MHGVKRRQWNQELLEQKKLNDAKNINNYRRLTSTILGLKEKKEYSLDNLQKSKELLKINPEFNAVWNFRRDSIIALKEQLEAKFWEEELDFVMAELKIYPKVYWIWGHRVWVLNNYPGSPVSIWKRELLIVSKLLELDARNYHGWHYRRIVISSIENRTGESMDKEEFEYSSNKINNNISNFSAWHQRANMIPAMFANNEIEDKKKFIDDELKYITNAMYTDAEDQSVWIYIKWFLNSDIVSNTYTTEEYVKMIDDVKQNILIINQDDLDFSGKENAWCLKMLIVIEEISKRFGSQEECRTQEYVKKLIEIDPLRKNRYLHLRNKT
ncbi:hypothetical protein TPHA_0N00960 [Tetrapisispora phaffii CBS 4417]|uniref:Geranylgeranyl transferase type-2 subunit alpha n=1 Tax=Tetrapisispora phaffii (strain ATCC 24235 / CBS 4417 / NBRC 1672 / NRRL Y-8282 / UCD 70-5) TaxID=1071381 RepID=G8C149_TETPH|nr:hypothetical protein TPHA_0N00960 [Tetrapisispora phaffii CBS 4417]CCE65877.1 hypothetical protein TPHA_0N00960 [Tetrapisispora phaffii CBS 4417]